jgi:DNA polymerase-3 subunit gamma/tau
MAYQIIARKWRPQNFDEVVYQDHITKTIKNSIKNGRVYHAYLFSGPRGVGKTTMARIVAKSLNCIEGPTDNPCGKCENCLEIRDGNSFDVIEIDGASNRGIENIRELRENVKFAPMKSRYKVYIVDEVHMLTKEAFNALLKTLEEPPGYIVFIFATTEIHQVPDTILSRCQKYFFKKIAVEAIVRHLRHIIDKEGYKFDEKSLYPIARSSDGSMRDAQSLLDQVLSFSDGEVGEEDTLAILGVVPFESYLNILRYICNLDAKNTLGEIDRVVSLGIDIPRYVAGFVDVLRTVRLIKNDVSIQGILGLSDEESSLFKEVGEKFHDEELSVIFQIANELMRDLRYSSSERINLEMAALDMISAKRSPSLSSLIMRLEAQHEHREGDAGEGSSALKDSGSDGNSDTAVKSGVEIDSGEVPTEDRGIEINAENIGDMWNSILDGINGENKKFLFEKLKMAKTEFRDGALHILYSSTEGAYYSRILDAQDIDFIKNEIYKKTGRSIAVSVGTIDDGMSESHPGVSENVPPEGAMMVKNPELDEVENVNPVVEKIKDIFHGQIIKKGDK